MAQYLTDYASALAAGQAIAEQQLDPLELVESCLQQAQQSSGVFISTMAERARAEAKAARQRAQAGCRLGPLDGVPVAWKDLFDVQGTVTTAGSRVFAQAEPAAADAAVVRRAAAAGVVSIGKTNLSELAYSGLGLNPHFGTPHNPQGGDARRVPGGSSSGSAVAVATGCAAIGVATDTAGSIRIPAAFNGLVGFRTSSARHDRGGVLALSRTLDSLGPVARTVADCAVFEACMAGRTGPLPAQAVPADCRVVLDMGVLEDPELAPAVRDNLEIAVAQLQRRGVVVQRRRLQAVAAVRGLIERVGWLGAAEAYTEHRALLDSAGAALLDPRVRTRLLAAASMPVDAVVTLYQQRTQLQRALAAELDGAVLMLPTVAHTAPLLEPLLASDELFARVNLATLRLTMIGSYLDLPTFALPTGIDGDGQFTSLQLSLPTGEDDRLVPIALLVERVLNQI
ncbi:amidase [Marinobacterium rhizophilum]|uniref:Amidase n=1 Tax=Marinobacterium rhizophilum TaxID=420402 RepID=A0ABY5HI02_9GAMM|nr:amidase [Marinobacterium rhizophilum]UTW11724.1 amidase [Marinobacterium rhizophilum]